MVSGSNKFPQFSLYLSLKFSKLNAIGKSVILFCFMLLLTQHHYMILFSSLKVFPLCHCPKVLLEKGWKNCPCIKAIFNFSSVHTANLPCTPGIYQLRQKYFWGEPSAVRDAVAVEPHVFLEVLLKDGFKVGVLGCLCSPGAKRESGLEVGGAGDVAGEHRCPRCSALGQDRGNMDGRSLCIKPAAAAVPSLQLCPGHQEGEVASYCIFLPSIRWIFYFSFNLYKCF